MSRIKVVFYYENDGNQYQFGLKQFERLEKNYKPDDVVFKVQDISDSSPEIYGFKSLPAVIFFNSNGNQITAIDTYLSKDKIVRNLKNLGFSQNSLRYQIIKNWWLVILLFLIIGFLYLKLK